MAEEQYLSKNFVVGSIAHWLGKKADESRSHEWTVFLRSANPDEDISTYVKKVVFVLHPTLQPPTRVLESGPFEVVEQGWGEFEITLQVFFHDSREKPVELQHMLKLYPEGETSQHAAAKPVVAERYDEFVFNQPSDALRSRLAADVVPSSKGWRHSPNAKWLTDYEADARQESSLQQVYQVITAELQNASKRRLQVEEDLKRLRQELGTTAADMQF